MSPRRMDISSLLRDPSPPHDDDGHPSRHADRPRTIDALLHRPQPPEQPPPSLLSLLNSPPRDTRHSFVDSPNLRPRRPAPPHTPPSTLLSSHYPPSPPLLPTTSQPHRRLSFDALVHVASEERRRIAYDRDSERDLRFAERDNPAARPFVYDHDHAYSSYPIPSHRHPDPPFPHKRTPDTCPPSPPCSSSPHPTFSLVSSPSTRHQLSASPINNYPTLRRQLILHMEPAPSAVPANDAHTIVHSPPISHHHTSPFSLSLQSHQLPTHSSPRNNSPQRHSPQHLHPHHYSSPIQSGSLVPSSPDTNAMSPRNYGPRMAGGIDVLLNDSTSIRDTPRPELSIYRGPAHDIPTERLAHESRADHARHEPPKLSPLLGRAFSPHDDGRRAKGLPHQAVAQESVLLRERVRSRPLRSPSANVTTDIGKGMNIPVTEAGFPAQPPPGRFPIRVWEEQPTVRETSRCLSPAYTPGIVSGPAEGHTWVETGQSGHRKRSTSEDRATELRQDVAKDVLTRPLPTCAEPPPGHLLSDLQTPAEGIRLDPQLLLQTPMQSISPVESGLAHLQQASLPIPPNPRTPTSPVPDLHLKNFETQPELLSDVQVDATTSVPLPLSDTIITEELSLGEAELMPEAMDTDDILMANPLPRQSPELVQPVPVLAEEPETAGIPIHSAHATGSQHSTRSPSQQPLSMILPAEGEHDVPPEDALIFSPTQREPFLRRYPELEYSSQRKPQVSEQAMMDVDEELLSLVEDRPVRTAPVTPDTQIESRLDSSQAPDGPSSVPSSHLVLKGPVRTDEEKDRLSMPPPAARGKKAEKDKTNLATGIATGPRKKKEGASKPAAKPKQPPKPRAKPVPKPKAKPNADASSKGSVPKGIVNANARSRSASVIPGATDDVVPEVEAVESDKEDDKLYCVCKTRYDEDRMMIACDRCDEWFHTLCVNMPDLEIDLVDQFTCPPCIQKNPHLRTTWKQRCLFGLQHENPLSPEACHKPSRGAFSKYCSDDCGIKYMRTHIAQWEKSGGTRNLLWESVKNAAKREGVVVCVETDGANPRRMTDFDSNKLESKPLDSAAKRRAEREVARLNARLEQVVKEREFMKHELDMVMWREKVVELASERAGKVDECGWDQRLCFGEEEWVDFGSEVLESYEEERVKVESGDDAMPLDGVSAIHGEWWCTGKKKCERHAGWQKLRAAEVSFDKETKEGILLKLTTREREIRKRIEDILYPQTGTLQPPSNQLNGSEKSTLEWGGKR